MALAGGADLLLDEIPYLMLTEGELFRRTVSVLLLMKGQTALYPERVLALFC